MSFILRQFLNNTIALFLRLQAQDFIKDKLQWTI